MQINYLVIVVLSVCAITFYQMGRYERSWGLLWAALSVLVSFGAMRYLPTGFLGVLLGQVALFVAITIYRMRRPPD